MGVEINLHKFMNIIASDQVFNDLSPLLIDHNYHDNFITLNYFPENAFFDANKREVKVKWVLTKKTQVDHFYMIKLIEESYSQLRDYLDRFNLISFKDFLLDGAINDYRYFILRGVSIDNKKRIIIISNLYENDKEYNGIGISTDRFIILSKKKKISNLLSNIMETVEQLKNTNSSSNEMYAMLIGYSFIIKICEKYSELTALKNIEVHNFERQILPIWDEFIPFLNLCFKQFKESPIKESFSEYFGSVSDWQVLSNYWVEWT